jgi:hypothetical protein
MKAIALTIAAGALGLAFAGSASALPLAPLARAVSETGDVQLVRDGCRRGFRYSRSRDRCVRIRDRDVRRDDDNRGAAAVGTAISVIDALVGSRNNGGFRNGNRGGNRSGNRGSNRGQRTGSKSASGNAPPAPGAPPPVVKGSGIKSDLRTQTESGTVRKKP